MPVDKGKGRNGFSGGHWLVVVVGAVRTAERARKPSERSSGMCVQASGVMTD